MVVPCTQCGRDTVVSSSGLCSECDLHAQIQFIKYSPVVKLPRAVHAHLPDSLGSLCGKVPTVESELLNEKPPGARLCKKCAQRLEVLGRRMNAEGGSL